MLTMILFLSIRKLFPGFNLNKTICISSFSKKLLTCIVLLTLCSFFGFTQKHSYSIIKSGKTIGTCSVNRQQSENKVSYSISSDAKTGFILNILVNVMIEEIFESGTLVNSTFIRKINGIETIRKTADKTIDSYKMNGKSANTKIIFPKIDYTMASMYLIEPVKRKFVYSEYYQQNIPVIALGVNRYLLLFPDGNKSYYTYVSGICTEIEAHTDWALLHIILNNTTSQNLCSDL